MFHDKVTRRVGRQFLIHHFACMLTKTFKSVPDVKSRIGPRHFGLDRETNDVKFFITFKSYENFKFGKKGKRRKNGAMHYEPV